MKRRHKSLLLLAVLLPSLSGCVIYTPFEVVRFWADYNTERMCNAQVESFDHLPPKTARVRLMRWGYNVGPTSVPPKGTLGLGTGVWEEKLMFWRKFGAKNCPTYPPADGSLTPTSTPTPTAQPPAEAAPTLPPPAPPADELEQGPPPAPNSETTLRPRAGVQVAGYQGNAASRGAQPVLNSNWVFYKSTRAPEEEKADSSSQFWRTESSQAKRASPGGE